MMVQLFFEAYLLVNVTVPKYSSRLNKANFENKEKYDLFIEDFSKAASCYDNLFN